MSVYRRVASWQSWRDMDLWPWRLGSAEDFLAWAQT